MRCEKANACRAPLCPLDGEEATYHYVWYPDEPVCTAREFQELQWIRRQRDVAAKSRSRDGFFTLKMLQPLWTISEAIRGMDPDSTGAQPQRLQEPRGQSGRSRGRHAGSTRSTAAVRSLKPKKVVKENAGRGHTARHPVKSVSLRDCP